MFVSSRPSDKVKDEVSMLVTGYALKSGSDATVAIGGATFPMYTQNDGAWVKNSSEESRLVDAMRKGGYNLGGEQSGHLIFLDHSSTGDGLIGALQVLALMIRTGKPLSELAREAMERVPQVLESVTLAARKPLEDMASLQSLVERVKSMAIA